MSWSKIDSIIFRWKILLVLYCFFSVIFSILSETKRAMQIRNKKIFWHLLSLFIRRYTNENKICLLLCYCILKKSLFIDNLFHRTCFVKSFIVLILHQVEDYYPNKLPRTPIENTEYIQVLTTYSRVTKILWIFRNHLKKLFSGH